MTFGQMLTIWLEEWVGGVLRFVPGVTGFTLRYALARLLFRRLDGFCLLYPGVWVSHAFGIAAGRNVAVNVGALLDGRGGLTIGANVLIGPYSVVLSSEHQWSDATRPIVEQGRCALGTTIGDDVYVGSHVTITPGVTIATGTVVAAGAVVTADTEAYTIVAGVPARVVGRRPRAAIAADAGTRAAGE
jgi:acetyltransferase-like isoleucine patch superfamily enzyme